MTTSGVSVCSGNVVRSGRESPIRRLRGCVSVGFRRPRGVSGATRSGNVVRSGRESPIRRLRGCVSVRQQTTSGLHDTAWTLHEKGPFSLAPRGLSPCRNVCPRAWGPPIVNTANSPDAPKEHRTPLNHDTAWTQQFKKDHFRELRLGDCLLIGIFSPRRVGASYYQHRQFPRRPQGTRNSLKSRHCVDATI